ncbi:MAG TPA: hypothetical protein VI916_04410, partial [Acidimicrobiia bacterium]|nr:hypothetical protein [Acidimicrobiia bacterium]
QGRVGVAGIAAAPDGGGYWIVDQRGGVFAFGDARYFGSVPGVGLCEWADVVAVTASATGQGYWMIGTDGRVWSFGDARYLGAMDVGGIQHARAVGMTLAA